MIRQSLCLLALPLLVCAAKPLPTKLRTIGSPGDWIRPEDYPKRALHDRRVGIVAFELEVDAQGRAEHCMVLESSGTPELDEAACTLVKERSRFEPGRDARGKPIGGRYRNRVRWQLPDIGPFAPIDFMIEFDVDTNGTVSNCHITSKPTAPDLDSGCAMVAEDMKTRAPPSQPSHVRMRTSIEVEELPSDPKAPN
ncbi:energy transducer TonB [Rhizorhabdus wittichii]|uniref:Energy transducer TonB n=1 Tax=Rhizorhabdus wittichii TaxID=160791 RepID=A0A975CZQ3_9SPHN|nr:energy transducer TonB [Rhizorhabdus wittichii]QTH20570.1 energy transducer TonB [Rhizorhabdus wittichii]